MLVKKRVILYLGKDKVSNSKNYRDDIRKNNIEIEDKKLIDLLYYSLEKYPRKYLFQSRDKQINETILLTFLREITRIVKIDIDTMRSIYISHSYNNYNLTYKQKDEMAKKMRHTPDTAHYKYLKVIEQTKPIKQKMNELKY